MFFVLRAIYGIGMGGEWGVGASLAMESAPARWRGVLSGVVQSGYSIGYLLAAVAARVVLPRWGWRAMFWVGGIPALLAFYIRFRVKESEAWKQHRAPTVGSILRTASGHWKIFSYLVLLMTLMMFLVPWHAGSVSPLSEGGARAGAGDDFLCGDSVQHRGGGGSVHVRIFVGTLWAEAGHAAGAGAGDAVDSGVGIWRIAGVLVVGACLMQTGRAGGMGHHSCAFE